MVCFWFFNRKAGVQARIKRKDPCRRLLFNKMEEVKCIDSPKAGDR
jgi:hypothetical protein